MRDRERETEKRRNRDRILVGECDLIRNNRDRERKREGGGREIRARYKKEEGHLLVLVLGALGQNVLANVHYLIAAECLQIILRIKRRSCLFAGPTKKRIRLGVGFALYVHGRNSLARNPFLGHLPLGHARKSVVTPSDPRVMKCNANHVGASADVEVL